MIRQAQGESHDETHLNGLTRRRPRGARACGGGAANNAAGNNAAEPTPPVEAPQYGRNRCANEPAPLPPPAEPGNAGNDGRRQQRRQRPIAFLPLRSP